MSEITRELIDGKVGKTPLEAYPWQEYADRLIYWAKEQSCSHRAFAFDVLMSLAYVDTIPSIQKNFKIFKDLPQPYNVHFGFINLCAPLLLSKQAWHFQKAAKPLSGVIGKLTSEIIRLNRLNYAIQTKFTSKILPNKGLRQFLANKNTLSAEVFAQQRLQVE